MRGGPRIDMPGGRGRGMANGGRGGPPTGQVCTLAIVFSAHHRLSNNRLFGIMLPVHTSHHGASRSSLACILSTELAGLCSSSSKDCVEIVELPLIFMGYYGYFVTRQKYVEQQGAAPPAAAPGAASAVVPGEEGSGLTTAMLAAAHPEQQKQVRCPSSGRLHPLHVLHCHSIVWCISNAVIMLWSLHLL